jgi:hypothetical protein
MNPAKSFFFKSSPFELRESVKCDLWMSHTNAYGVTYFHVYIGCHVNPNGHSTTFAIQNE